MRLREESRIKEKVELRIETRHVFYLIVWSIILSGAIFYTGLLVGKKGRDGVTGILAPNLDATATRSVQPRLTDTGDIPLSFKARLDGHPEQEEMGDVVLNTLSKLRIETRERLAREDEQIKEELTDKLFPGKRQEADTDASGEEFVSSSPLSGRQAGKDGEEARHRHRQRLASVGGAPVRPAASRLGQVPPMPVDEPEPEPEPQSEQDEARSPAQGVGDGAAAEKDGEKVTSGKGGHRLGGDDRPSRVIPEQLYTIQAKAFREKTEADTFLSYLKGQLASSRHKPYLVAVELAGKGKWYRVRIGKFTSHADAQRFKLLFEQKEGFSTLLVTL